MILIGKSKKNKVKLRLIAFKASFVLGQAASSSTGDRNSRVRDELQRVLDPKCRHLFSPGSMSRAFLVSLAFGAVRGLVSAFAIFLLVLRHHCFRLLLLAPGALPTAWYP